MSVAVKWKSKQIFEQSAAVAAKASSEAKATPIVPKRRSVGPQAHIVKSSLLLESVEVTPGGRRKHCLSRSSPGGTTRTALYTSPNKAEIMQEMGDDCDDATLDAELESERWSRRRSAMAKVPGQHNDAQRSATARSKRLIGVQAAPQKRCDRKPWGYKTGFFERRVIGSVGMEPGYGMPGHSWALYWKKSGGTTGDTSSMWSAYFFAESDACRRKESSVVNSLTFE